MSARGIRTGFEFLDQRAGFTIVGSEFRSSQTISEALLVGLGMTLRVAVIGIVVAMILGLLVGVGRLSSNWLVRRTAGIYVELLRNVPPLVLIVFFYFALLTRLPGINEPLEPGGVAVLSNRGLWLPWITVDEGATLFLVALAVGVVLAVAVGLWRTRRFDRTGDPHHRFVYGALVFLGVALVAWLVLDRPAALSVPVRDGRRVDGGAQLFPEYGALLISLTLYTSAFIAEIIRGAIQAVPRGQVEAASSLGLAWSDRLRYVVLPQALRIATPPTGNEFLNLTKNVSLGVAIAYPELLRVSRIAIGNGQPAPQLVFISLAGYLALSLIISLFVNVANRRLRLVER
jgi:general L-amino acid transport system permease protein